MYTSTHYMHRQAVPQGPRVCFIESFWAVEQRTYLWKDNRVLGTRCVPAACFGVRISLESTFEAMPVRAAHTFIFILRIYMALAQLAS